MLEWVVIAEGIFSGAIGLFIWWLKKHWDKQEKKRAAQEHNRELLMLKIMENGQANGDLCVAIARAVQRIPDAKCNGDMTAALAKMEKVQEEEHKFLTNLGIKHIYEK